MMPGLIVLIRAPRSPHRAARPRRTDGLHHRLLGADALERRVGADASRELPDALDPLVPALDHDAGRAELARERLPRRVTAHGDDPLGAPLLRGEHPEETDRAISDDDDGVPGPHPAVTRNTPAAPRRAADAEKERRERAEGAPSVARGHLPTFTSAGESVHQRW